MDSLAFDELQRSFANGGPAAAIDHLCTRLREQKDYGNLFYALLMKKRHEMGVSPLPTGPIQELPVALQGPYEQAVREAGRYVGGLYLEAGNIPQAWAYFRMISETGPVAAAMENHQPRDEDEVHQLVQIAFYEGVHPRRGFDWILERSGICSAITTLGNSELPFSLDVRRYCVRRLVRALYEELRERLAADIAQQTGKPPPAGPVRELLAEYEGITEMEFAHIDVSHLNAVVQMSIQLEPGEEMDLARELCRYGRLLQLRLQYPGEPPFEEPYRAYGLYLDALAGERVEEAVAYFRGRAEELDPETDGTYPAEVLVNLLLRLDRPAEALVTARRFLAGADNRRLSCPSIVELCQYANDYGMLAEIAREQGDAVHFVAGLIAGRKQREG